MALPRLMFLHRFRVFNDTSPRPLNPAQSPALMRQLTHLTDGNAHQSIQPSIF